MSRAATSDDELYASAGEAGVAISAMTAADLARLGRIAQLRAAGLPSLSWEDLINEAIEKVLSGARRWPTNVPLIVFLREVIRSLASEAWRRHAQMRIVEPRAAGDEDGDPLLQHVDSAPGPEREAIARNLLAHVQSTFADDPTVLGILASLGEGATAEEIQRELKLSPREYETCRRRLRRGLARNFPEGLSS